MCQSNINSINLVVPKITRSSGRFIWFFPGSQPLILAKAASSRGRGAFWDGWWWWWSRETSSVRAEKQMEYSNYGDYEVDKAWFNLTKSRFDVVNTLQFKLGLESECPEMWSNLISRFFMSGSHDHSWSKHAARLDRSPLWRKCRWSWHMSWRAESWMLDSMVDGFFHLKLMNGSSPLKPYFHENSERWFVYSCVYIYIIYYIYHIYIYILYIIYYI